MSADLIRQKARERHFLEQLLDGKKLENYKIPVPIKAELRKYQQVGFLLSPLSSLDPPPPRVSTALLCFSWSLCPVAGRSELALLSEQI